MARDPTLTSLIEATAEARPVARDFAAAEARSPAACAFRLARLRGLASE